MIVESRPWVVGQTLTHTNGLLYVATGTGSYKAAAPEEVIVEVEPIRQEHFYPGDVLPDWMIEEVQVCLVDGTLVDVYDTEQLPDDVNGMVIVDAVTGMPAFNQKPVKLEDQRQTVYGVGDTLPEWMVGKVNVCLLVTGEVVELCDDEAIPDDIDGTVIVDALTGVPTYNQGAQKPAVVVKPIVSQLDEPTKEDVESGVCIWRNESDGCLYTVTVEDDGSCTWFSSDKNDTNTFATVIEAPAAGVDDYNNQYSASQDLIVFADDSIMAMAVDTDTVDGYSEQDTSDGSQLDAQGNPIPAGHAITTYYDATGAVVNSRDDEKTQGSTTTPSDDGLFHEIVTSDNTHTKFCVNQYKGLRPNADGTKTEIFIDQAGNEVTGEVLDEPSQSGEPQLSTVDAAGNTTYVDSDGVIQTVPATDVNGDPVDPSQAVWNFVDGDGNYLGSKPCKDETVLVENGSGALYPINLDNGNQIIQLGCCISNCVIDEEGKRFTQVHNTETDETVYYSSVAPFDVATPTGDVQLCSTGVSLRNKDETDDIKEGASVFQGSDFEDISPDDIDCYQLAKKDPETSCVLIPKRHSRVRVIDIGGLSWSSNENVAYSLENGLTTANISYNGLTTANQDLLKSTGLTVWSAEFDIENPTCDEICCVVSGNVHGLKRIPRNRGGMNSFLGFSTSPMPINVFAGAPIDHTDSSGADEFITEDHQSYSALVKIPAKTTKKGYVNLTYIYSDGALGSGTPQSSGWFSVNLNNAQIRLDCTLSDF